MFSQRIWQKENILVYVLNINVLDGIYSYYGITLIQVTSLSTTALIWAQTLWQEFLVLEAYNFSLGVIVSKLR